MSCSIVSRHTIDMIVTAFKKHYPHKTPPTQDQLSSFGELLCGWNVSVVNERYFERNENPIYRFRPLVGYTVYTDLNDEVGKRWPLTLADYIHAIGTLHCQVSDSPHWEKSDAGKTIKELQQIMAEKLGMSVEEVYKKFKPFAGHKYLTFRKENRQCRHGS